jgi:hypothetical protein
MAAVYEKRQRQATGSDVGSLCIVGAIAAWKKMTPAQIALA